MSYALVNLKTGEEFRHFSGEPQPRVLDWPNGDVSHAPSVGDERGGYRFVKVEYDPGPPDEFYSVASVATEVLGDKMVVTRQWAPSDPQVKADKLRQNADAAILALVSQADLARAIATGKPPSWADTVAAIDADLQKALSALGLP